jgi:hypothetical protein
MSTAKRKLEAIDARRESLITKAEAGDECAISDLWKEFGDEVDPSGELDVDSYASLQWALNKND